MTTSKLNFVIHSCWLFWTIFGNYCLAKMRQSGKCMYVYFQFVTIFNTFAAHISIWYQFFYRLHPLQKEVGICFQLPSDLLEITSVQIIPYFNLLLDQVSFFRTLITLEIYPIKGPKRWSQKVTLEIYPIKLSEQLTWYMKHSYSLVNLGVMSLKLSTYKVTITLFYKQEFYLESCV